MQRPQVSPMLSNVQIFALSLLFLTIGHGFVLQRTATNLSETMAIGGDTNYYLSMINGNWVTTPSPFKFRIFVPILARLLPYSPTDSLRLISYVSLFLCYVLILLTCKNIGLNRKCSVIGFLAVWASTWHLYYYNNPFLTDAFALLMLCVMIYSYFSNKYFIFLAAAVLGVLTREPTIFLVPSWIIKKEWRRTIFLIVISIIVLLVPRYFLSSATDPTLVAVFYRVGVLQHPLTFARNVFLAWGFMWFLPIIGILHLSKDEFVNIIMIYFILLCGAIFTSLIAVDTGRMFSILFPIHIIASANFYAKLDNERNILLKYAFVGLAIFQAMASLPNVILNESIWNYKAVFLSRVMLLVVELMYIVFVLVNLGKSILEEVKEKMMYLYRYVKKEFTS